MQPKLFALLVDAMQKFISSDERCKDAEFWVGKDTATLMARAAEAVYDGMADADKLAKSQGEE